MKFLIIISINFITFLSCVDGSNNKKSENVKESGMISSNDTISIIANKLSDSYDRNDYNAFFTSFPGDFKIFNLLYDFNDSLGAGILYYSYENHINFLFDSIKVDRQKFIIKIISISLTAKWDADAINLFQYKTKRLLLEYPDEFIEILQARSIQDAKKFWRFIFDNLHPSSQQNTDYYLSVFSLVNSKDSLQAKILKEEFIEIGKLDK